ncbi:MAG: hypothetical protein ABW220_18385 [Burkholderiaceae bacterium]
MALRSLLLLRSAVNVLFAVFMFSLVVRGIDSRPLDSAMYLLADGAIGLAAAVALWFTPRASWLFVLALVDSLLRLAIGAMIYANPDMGSHILLNAVFFTAVIIAFIVMGLAGIIYNMLGSRVNDGSGPPRSVAPAALMVSVCSMLLGLGLLFGIPADRRMLFGLDTLLLGLALLYAARRVGRTIR